MRIYQREREGMRMRERERKWERGRERDRDLKILFDGTNQDEIRELFLSSL